MRFASQHGQLKRWFRRDWPTAITAARRLMIDHNDTAQVFTVIRALAGTSLAKGYMRLLDTPDGGRMAYERVELAERFTDRDWLAQFPPGAVGQAYADFVAKQKLSASGLVRVSRSGLHAARNNIPHPLAWMGRRVRDTHDVWHVLTGYRPDPLGEACLVSFSYAQTGGLGWAVIALAAFLTAPLSSPYPLRRALLEGYSRGRAAAWLLGEDYEALMAEPLDSARRRLKLAPAPVYASIPAAVAAAPKSARGRRPRIRVLARGGPRRT